MTVIVKTVTRWVKAFIFLYGIYIIITGHITPGGGFPGGVILACSYILLTLAYGKEFVDTMLKPVTASRWDSTGALLFLVVALLGLGFGGIFFANILHARYPDLSLSLFSAGFIPISNIAIGIKVGFSIFSVFVILSILRIVINKKGLFTMLQEEEEE